MNNNDISNNDISNNIINETRTSNILLDLSNNLNNDDTLTNILQNIYNDVSNINRQENRNILNDHERLRYFFNYDNSLNNIFNDINPLLMNPEPSVGHQMYMTSIDQIFSNLIRNTMNNNTNNFNNILQESLMNDKPKFKKVISDEGKKQLKHCLFKESEKNNNSCPIFYVDFSESDEVIELPCKHCFVPEAITRWLENEQPMCPVCRFELHSKEIEIEKKDEENRTNNDEQERSIDSDDENEENDSDDENENNENVMIQMAIMESLKD